MQELGDMGVLLRRLPQRGGDSSVSPVFSSLRCVGGVLTFPFNNPQGKGVPLGPGGIHCALGGWTRWPPAGQRTSTGGRGHTF